MPLDGIPLIPSSSSSAAKTPRSSVLPVLRSAIWLSTVSLPHVLVSPSATPQYISLAENKLLIVKLGGLEPLIRQMLSPNVEVQCNAVGCITNLATHGACLTVRYLLRAAHGFPVFALPLMHAFAPGCFLVLLSYTCRRQQDKDRKVGCSGPAHPISTLQGYASSTQRYWRFAKHDSFRCAIPTLTACGC